MQVVHARFAALVDTSEVFDRTSGAVGDQLDGLASGLVRLRERWIGEASDAFDACYTDWLDAAESMRATIGEFSDLLDTVHGNYREADRASGALWDGVVAGAGVGSTHAMGVGPQPGGGFRITLDDLRVTAKTLADLQHRLIAALDHAQSALAGTEGMGSDDHVLARWRDRFDPMAGTTARAARSVSVVLGVIAQKLTDTANAYIDAENASTPGSPALERLPAPDVRFDHVGLIPPSSTGPGSEFVPPELVEYWPNAWTDRLRVAGDAWRALHQQLYEINNTATTAFGALFDANSGAAFSLMRGYWDKLCATERPTPCTPDPGAGMRPFNLVSYMTGMLAESCHGLAGLVDNTRRDMAQAAQEVADDPVMDIFGTIAEIMDAWLTRGASTVVVEVGKAALFLGVLGAERDRYLGYLNGLVDRLVEENRNRLNHFSDTHDTPQKELPNLTEVGDVATGDLRGKWHELTAPHPTPDQIHITADRRTHILDGDGTGGGHRAGSPNDKSHFPPNWSDDKIIQEIVSVARNPETIEVNKHGRWKAIGVRDGVLIEVIVNPDGTIRTAWPVSGPGVRPQQ